MVEITRKLVPRNAGASAEALFSASCGGTVLNTAFIERLNGKCRHAARRLTALESGMWLLDCTYNLYWPHHELSRREASAQGKRGEVLLTPAIASGLTDHIWSIWELLSYRVASPPWLAPKRRRSRQSHMSESTNWRANNHTVGPSFVFGKGSYARLPVSGVLPFFLL